jgi:hypothetical protein
MSEPEQSAAIPKKRKRFQFSLRTLLFVVLAYTVAWGVTASWGVDDTCDKIEDSLRKSYNTVQITRSSGHLVYVEAPTEYHYRVSAPFPFVQIIRVSQRREDEKMEEEYYRNVDFWFLGLRRKLYQKNDHVKLTP